MHIIRIKREFRVFFGSLFPVLNTRAGMAERRSAGGFPGQGKSPMRPPDGLDQTRLGESLEHLAQMVFRGAHVLGDNPCTNGKTIFCDDNCPNSCNVGQLDADGDGLGDVCDPAPGCGGCNQPACEQTCAVDSDSDGFQDDIDNCPNNCNVEQLDADGDGIGDVCDPDPGCGGCDQTPCEAEC